MTEYSIKISDFEKICRVCMKLTDTGASTSILSTIANMIQYCTSVEVSVGDFMPQQVCEHCFRELENACALKRVCENSNLIFRKIIEEQSSNIKKEDDLDIADESKAYFAHNDNDNISSKSDDDDDKNSELPLLVELNVKKELPVEDNTKNEEQKEDQKKICNKKKRKRKGKKLKRVKFDCDKCSKSYSSVYKLRDHRCKVLKSIKLDCDLCNKRYSSQYKLKVHKCIKELSDDAIPHSHKPIVCETCGKTIQKRYLKRHIEVVHKDVSAYPCKLCPKIFSYNLSLKQHIARVHENKPKKYSVLCNICGKGLESSAYLKIHLRTHTGEKPYACDKCDKKYRRKEALKIHIDRIHLDKRTHVCTICLRAFFDKKILRGHMTTHTGERPYQCKFCERSFGQHAALWAHTKKAHAAFN